MRTRLKSFLFLALLGITALSFSQSAVIVENIVDEGDVRDASDYTIEITVSNDTFLTVDLAKTALLNGLKGSSTEFDAVIDAVALTDVVFTNDDTVATITISQFTSYFIAADDAIGLTIPAGALKSEASIVLTDSVRISNLLPLISITNQTYTEADIRTSSISFDITLDGDVWASSLSADFKDRIDGDGSAWDADIRPNLTITRLSASVVHVTIPQTGSFDISVDEDVTISIIAADLDYSTAGPYSVSGTKTISPIPPTIVASGSITTVSDEGDIRGSSYEIVLTLFEDTWVAGVGTVGATTESLVNSITCIPSDGGWDDLIIDILGGDQGVSNVSAPSGGIVTITVPVKSDFNITQDISLSIDAPASLFTNSASVLSDADFAGINRITPTIVITAIPDPLTEANLNDGKLTVKLYEETFLNSTLQNNYITINCNLAGIPGLYINGDSDVDYFTDDSATIDLKFNGSSFSVDQLLGITIGQEELSGSEDLTSAQSVTVYAVIEPVILSVSIPDVAMGIGDVVTATIYVDDDDDNIFTYGSGTIAGRSISVFRRIDKNTYEGDFQIIENSTPEYLAIESIPVVNLQLFNGSTPGNIFSSSIIGSHDAIDSRRPIVDLIDFNNGSYKIGDQITAVIHATESGLTFDDALTKINTIALSASNVQSNESGSGIYQLNYTVEDGNPDLSGAILVDVVMKDAVGNPSILFNTVSGPSPVIDANSPLISSITVTSSGVKVPGQTVVLTIVSTETGLNLRSGTHVNNIPSTSPRLSFVDNNNNTYAIIYTVSSDDDPVESVGDLKATIVLGDDAGNETTQVDGLLSNDVTIVTDAPSAYIFGGGQICPGGSMEVFVSLTGHAPFTIEVADGHGSSQVYSSIPSEYSFMASPSIPHTYSYTISSVVDALSVPGIGSGSAEVILNSNPTVSITNSRTSFQVTESPVALTANPSGGLFTGIGVVSSENLFYPNVADTTNSPHTIYYSYEDPVTGCIGQTSIEFSVLVEQADFNLPEVICYNAPPTIITGTITGGGTGVFYLKDRKGNLILGSLVNSGFNEATIYADGLRGGNYIVEFVYDWNGKPGNITTKDFDIDEIAEIKFIDPLPATFCNDDDAFFLETSLDDPNETYSYTGPGVSLKPQGYYFDPAKANLGGNIIFYEFISQDGCIRDSSFVVTNFDVPTVDFTPQAICIPTSGGPIGFTNLTDKEILVDEWRWEFGDVNSGEFNEVTRNTKTNEVHDFTAPGSRQISLEVITVSGCLARFDTIVDFGDKPVADFTWVSDCWVDNTDLILINESFSEKAWESFHWEIYDFPGGALIETIDTVTDAVLPPDAIYEFEEDGKYRIRLTAVNELLCSDDTVRILSLKPTISIAEAGFHFENFDDLVVDNPSQWSPEAESGYGNDIWKRDYVAHSFASSDDIGWYTDLSLRLAERSWIQSPCFDFSDTDRPMIRMDIAKSFDLTGDGAVLQYTLNDGAEWITVGNINEGINWYNSFDINEKPGGDDGSGNIGSSIGWSVSDAFDPDKEWVSAAHDLDMLIGEKTVIFGIFYATDDGHVAENEGIAIDNIYIGKRTKHALLEHFTNSASGSAISADNVVDIFASNNSLDVTNLQYHMHYPGEDPMNENNSSPGSARSFYYGVNQVPYAIMDGGVQSKYVYDFSSSKPSGTYLKELTLEDPLFELEVSFQLHSSRLSTSIRINALQAIDDADIVLNVAVVEKTVKYEEFNEDSIFHNVVLTMLPSPAGKLYSKSWTINENTSELFSWTYENVEDYDELMIVAFMQDRTSGKVLQVASEDVSKFGLGEVIYQYKSIKVYPNPAYDKINVELEQPLLSDGLIEITDMTGRVVYSSGIYYGEQRIQLDISNLYEGSYILQSKVNGKVVSRANFIKVR